MASTEHLTADFQVSKNIFFFSFPPYVVFSSQHFYSELLPFPLENKRMHLVNSKRRLKQPALASFKNSSNDQDKPWTSTLGENTDACSPSIADTGGPPKNTVMFHSNETWLK